MSTGRVIGIVGAGGYAREVAPIIKMKNEEKNLFFIIKDKSNELVNGLQVLSESEFFELSAEKYFNVAVADSNLRKRLLIYFMQTDASLFRLLIKPQSSWIKSLLVRELLFHRW